MSIEQSLLFEEFDQCQIRAMPRLFFFWTLVFWNQPQASAIQEIRSVPMRGKGWHIMSVHAGHALLRRRAQSLGALGALLVLRHIHLIELMPSHGVIHCPRDCSKVLTHQNR